MRLARKNTTLSQADVLEHIVVQRHPKKEASITNNIRNWRFFRGIETHQELSDLTVKFDKKGKGVNRVCISRLESSEMRYNEDHITLISKALNVAPRDLIGTNPFESGDIFAVYALASLTDKRKIDAFLRAMKKSKKNKDSTA